MPFVEHENSIIHFREDGVGAPVVALHGSASTGYQWESLTGYLSGRYRVIRPDLPGYGKSSRIAVGNQGLAAVVSALSTLFDEIDEPFHLVGHSFGGAVALKVAQMMPDMVRSLFVIEPAAFHLLAAKSTDRPFLNDLIHTAETMRADHANGDTAAAMERFIDFWNGEGAWIRTSEGLRDKLLRTTAQVTEDFAAIWAEPASFADYAKVNSPVLAVTGRQSPLVTQRLVERLAQCLPAADLAEIADAGHMVPLTDPHLIDPMIAAHIRFAEQMEQLDETQYHEAA